MILELVVSVLVIFVIISTYLIFKIINDNSPCEYCSHDEYGLCECDSKSYKKKNKRKSKYKNKRH
jgi:hypothetical protein